MAKRAPFRRGTPAQGPAMTDTADTLTIREMCAAFDVSPRTLRYKMAQFRIAGAA